MGALVALELALAHPARVASVAALNAVFCRTPAQREAVEARLAALDASGPPDWEGTIARWFGAPVPPALEAAAAHARALLDTVDPTGYARTYRLFARSDAAHRTRLCGLAVPALFLTGADDPNSTPAMSAAMAEIAPDARLAIVPGERHMLSLTDPEGVTARLKAFIAEARGTVGAARSGVPHRPAPPGAAA